MILAPRPTAIRLVTVDAKLAPERVPFGLKQWSDGGALGDSIAVLPSLPSDWPAHGHGPVGVVARQLPDPSTLAEGTLVVVLDGMTSSRGVLARVFSRKKARAARAVRCSALLARGYVRIGGGVDPDSELDLAWGFSR